jgi:hypothetical protein
MLNQSDFSVGASDSTDRETVVPSKVVCLLSPIHRHIVGVAVIRFYAFVGSPTA